MFLRVLLLNSTNSEKPLRYSEWIDPKSSQRLADFEPNPDRSLQWLVKYDILVDHWVIGTDEGVLWVDEQFLYIAGKQTSFAIPGNMLGSELVYKAEFHRPLERRYYLPISNGQSSAFGWPRNLAIQFDTQGNPPFIPERIAIEKAIRECARSAEPGMEGQLPPITPNSTAHTRQMLRGKMAEILLGRFLALCLFVGCALILEERMRFDPIFLVVIGLILPYQLIASAYPRLKLIYQALSSLEKYR